MAIHFVRPRYAVLPSVYDRHQVPEALEFRPQWPGEGHNSRMQSSSSFPASLQIIFNRKMEENTELMASILKRPTLTLLTGLFLSSGGESAHPSLTS